MMDLIEKIEDEDNYDWLSASMPMHDYATAAMQFAIYPDALIYPMLGLQGEVGELSEKLKKFFRDNEYEVGMEDCIAEMPAELRLEMAKELGDVLWYITAIASDLGYELDEVAELNLDKLESRNRRNKIKGSGDNR